MGAPRINSDFWSNAEYVTESGCLIWMKGTAHPGYGRVVVNGEAELAHRVAWRKTYGEIPKGLFVLHRCDTPPCINPKHLFLGTAKDNAQDMLKKGRVKTPWVPKTHCKRGHLFDEENTYIDVDGYKNCKKCKADWYVRNRVARSEKVNRRNRERYSEERLRLTGKPPKKYNYA